MECISLLMILNGQKDGRRGIRPDKDTEPVVIETEFEFEQGELLDLDKSDGLKKIR